MKRWLLALAVLLAVPLGYVAADYIVIVANLGQQREFRVQPNGGNVGGLPGGAGPGGGSAGGPGGDGGGGGRPGGGGPGPGGFGLAGGGGQQPGGLPNNPPPKPEDITIDPDAIPLYVTAIIEIENLSSASISSFATQGKVQVRHKWGPSLIQAMSPQTDALQYRANIIRSHDGKALPRLPGRYEEKHKEVFGGAVKPSTSRVLEDLALWALQHGMLAKFTEVMDDLAKEDKDDKVVATYLAVKANLAAPVKDNPLNPAQAAVKDKYKLKRSARPNDHYVVYHQVANDESPELQSRLDQLENNFRSFYYWFALKGINLPLPAERLTAVLTTKDEDFNTLHEVLTSSPVVSDGFFARRENLSVFSTHRHDVGYDALDKLASFMWEAGYNRNEVLRGSTRGVPPSRPKGEYNAVQAMALLLKVMELDSERAGISHDGARQLIYGAGLLPPNVVVPEWAQYGMGSFFETPLGSPWASTGAPNMENLPNFKDYNKLKRFEKTPGDTLRKVVTDSYFRASNGGKDAAAERKARASSWALTFFLMQTNADGMLRYYKEMAKQPRDVELDEDTLMGCFARAFDLVDANRNVDAKKVAEMGVRWFDFMKITHLDLEEEIQGIRAFIASVTKDPPKTTGPPAGGPGGLPPGGPAGGGGGGKQ